MRHITIVALLAGCLILPWASAQEAAPEPASEAAPAEAAPEAAAPAPAEAPPAEAAPAEAAPEAPAPLADIRQVQVQVWISETSESGLRKLGANLSYTRFTPSEFLGQPPVEQSGSLRQISTNVFSPTGDFGAVTLPTPITPAGVTDRTMPLREGAHPAGFGLEANIISTSTGTLEGAFRAIENKSDLDLISKPELLVVNGGVAEIKAGQQVPYQTVTYPKGEPALSVQWRDVGVNMRLQPAIMPNDFVQLHLQQLEVSENTPEKVKNLDLPVFSKRSQTGFVLVPNGQTLVIGGLSSRLITRAERRVPLLGRAPVLGMPFRRRNSEAAITNLLIFVSPTIVDLRSLSKEAVGAMEFWRDRGSEWRFADEISKEIEVMADGL